MPLEHNTFNELFTDIANAIRAKTGGTSSIVADTFPSAITAIPGGSESPLALAMVKNDFGNTSISLGSYFGSSIGSYAFYSTAGLTGISSPYITLVNDYAFAYSPSLNVVSFPNCSSIGSNAFRQTKISAIDFPNCSYVGSFAFNSLTGGSKTINLPEVVTIGNYAFKECYLSTGLSSLYFPKCTSIGSYAFSASFFPNNLLVDLPECLTIGSCAFSSCYGTDAYWYINLPKCTSLGTSAFDNTHLSGVLSLPACVSLGGGNTFPGGHFTEFYIPQISVIPGSCFARCDNLSQVLSS